MGRISDQMIKESSPASTRGRISAGPQVSSPPADQGGFMGGAKELVKKVASIPGEVSKAYNQFNIGAVKGLGSTLFGTAKLFQKTGIPDAGQKLIGAPPIAPLGDKPDFLKPEGSLQKSGFMAEQMGEFLLPSSKIAKAEQVVGNALAKFSPKVLPLLSRSAIEAGVVGSQTAMQQGAFNDQAKVNALVSAAFPIIGAGLSALKSGLGKGSKAMGEKIQETVLRPNASDLKDGFKVENIQKYDVGGSLAETVTKTHSKMNELSQQLDDLLKSNPDAKVNLLEAFNQTAKQLQSDKYSNFGTNTGVNRALKSLQSEIKSVSGGMDDATVDLLKANYIKRGAGTKGAWSYGRPEADSDAIEKVYTTFYQKMKKLIEAAAPEGAVKDINSQISDLISISNAALRRLPVAQRNNILSLTDTIGLFASVFDPKALALIGVNKLSKSGRFANFLVNAGEKILKSSAVPPSTGPGARIFGGPIGPRP